jgi:hypothetical protein
LLAEKEIATCSDVRAKELQNKKTRMIEERYERRGFDSKRAQGAAVEAIAGKKDAPNKRHFARAKPRPGTSCAVQLELFGDAHTPQADAKGAAVRRRKPRALYNGRKIRRGTAEQEKHHETAQKVVRRFSVTLTNDNISKMKRNNLPPMGLQSRLDAKPLPALGTGALPVAETLASPQRRMNLIAKWFAMRSKSKSKPFHC